MIHVHVYMLALFRGHFHMQPFALTLKKQSTDDKAMTSTD
jgi:hypothetical protein